MQRGLENITERVYKTVVSRILKCMVAGIWGLVILRAFFGTLNAFQCVLSNRQGTLSLAKPVKPGDVQT